MFRSYLIPMSELGFGHVDQPGESTCAKRADLHEMSLAGSFQWANAVGGRAKSPARILTV